LLCIVKKTVRIAFLPSSLRRALVPRGHKPPRADLRENRELTLRKR